MPSSFRLATFNLESLDDVPGEAPSLAERIAVLRPQLARAAADILCLQEVNGQPSKGKGPRSFAALEALLHGTPYEAFARFATESPHGGAMDRHNLLIISRWPFDARRQLRHDIVPPPEVRLATAEPPDPAAHAVEWDRPLLYAAVTLPGAARLHVLNLHLRAPLAAFVPGQKAGAFAWRSVGGWAEGFALAALKRNGQALEARLFVEQLFDADPEARIVVCGDFNAEAAEVPTRILRADPDDTGSGRLVGRTLVPVEATVPSERRFSVIHAGRHILLDHMLVSRGLMRWFHRAEIHNEALGDELVAYASVPGSPESYHAPVVAEFALPD
jgi:endonuclease/exonuclease/phosphatase family metal-dependent hydrolase